ncbi:MAG: CopD family protein [Myxococcota bacterium]
MEHLLDGALAHAAAVFGLALGTARETWRAATGAEPGEGGGLRRLAPALLGVAVGLHLIVGIVVVDKPFVAAVTTLLRDTFYGASLGVFAAASLGTVTLRGRWRGLAALGAAWGLARLGHAASAGTWSAAMVWTTLHIVAAVVWLGGLGMAVWGGARDVRRFGRVALGCVGVLGITGGLRTAQLVGAGWDRLGDGPEGVTWIAALLMKGGVVGVALVCAWRARRALRTDGSAAAVTAAAVTGELYAVGIVVILAALLARLPTP